MDRQAQREKDIKWLKKAQVGDEVAVTNTYLTGRSPHGHIVGNYGVSNTRIAYDKKDRIDGMVREFCTITKIRAIISDGYVVDNNVYDTNGEIQTEQPIEADGMIEDGWELEKDLFHDCGVCGYPHRNRWKVKNTQRGQLCEPTDELRKLAAKLRFNEDVKNLNFRYFSDDKVHELITSINQEFHSQITDGKNIETLWE